MSKQPHHFSGKKAANQRLTLLTAYDYLTASLIDNCQCDGILVGDSLGNTFAGYETTLPVTLEQMIYHTQCVTRACKHTLVIADMPFMSYHIDPIEGVKNAGKLIKEGGAQAIKIEASIHTIPTVEAIIKMGIPVMGHIGFTPQHLYQLGGYKVQGRQKEAAKKLQELAQKLEEIGCFSILMEMVPTPLAKTITKKRDIPTIGIGAGPHCDGQILATQDLIGYSPKKPAKFVKQYAQLHTSITEAICQFKTDINNNTFPSETESFNT